MEVNSLIICCSECGNQLRIPADKHIRFGCPRCTMSYEYKNGIRVTYKAKQKFVIPFPIFIIVFFLVFVIGIALLFNDTPKHPVLSAEVPAMSPMESSPTDSNTSSTIPGQNVDFFSKAKSNDEIRDSLHKALLEDLLEETRDELLDQLFDVMMEEAEKGDWSKANDWFEETSSKMEDRSGQWSQMKKKNEGKFAKVKNYIIGKDPSPIELPASTPTRLGDEKKSARLNVTNGTPYTITLYYAGVENKVVSIPANSSVQVQLVKGKYSIVAKVPGKNVRDYIGNEDYEGFYYSQRFIIRTSYTRSAL